VDAQPLSGPIEKPAESAQGGGMGQLSVQRKSPPPPQVSEPGFVASGGNGIAAQPLENRHGQIQIAGDFEDFALGAADGRMMRLGRGRPIQGLEGIAHAAGMGGQHGEMREASEAGLVASQWRFSASARLRVSECQRWDARRDSVT